MKRNSVLVSNNMQLRSLIDQVEDKASSICRQCHFFSSTSKLETEFTACQDFAASMSLTLPSRSKNSSLVRNALMVSRSEAQTSELQSLMRNSYAVFCLKNN